MNIVQFMLFFYCKKLRIFARNKKNIMHTISHSLLTLDRVKQILDILSSEMLHLAC